MLLKASRAAFFSIFFVVALPKKSDYDWSKCDKIFEDAGINITTFPFFVTHAIHSLTMEDLRRFEPSITEDNKVPTINKDLLSKNRVLSYAPHRPTSNITIFATDAMRAIDDVLVHLNDEFWDVRGFNPVERILHALHMLESWSLIQQEYEKLKLSPPSDQVCDCALDVDNNGILPVLEIMAETFHRPAEIEYVDQKDKSEAKVSVRKARYKIYYRMGRSLHVDVKPGEDLLKWFNDTAFALKPALVSKEIWTATRDQLVIPKVHPRVEPAMFLNCALRG